MKPDQSGIDAFVRIRRDWAFADLRDELRFHWPTLTTREIEKALRGAGLQQSQATGGNDEGSPSASPASPIPFVTARLLAERGFWSLTPSGQLSLFEWEDIRGRLEVVPSVLGPPGVFEAITMGALVSLWAHGARDGAQVEASASELAEFLGLSWHGALSGRLTRAVDTLTATTYRYIGETPDGGESSTFHLLDESRTRWRGAPTSPKRRISATFSRVVLEVLGNRRMIRPVDLEVLRALGEQRELARRLFLFLEASPGHRVGDRELIERVIDERLAGSMGSSMALRELVKALRRASSVIEEASGGRYAVEIKPRAKRVLRRGDPKYLLSARRNLGRE